MMGGDDQEGFDWDGVIEMGSSWCLEVDFVPSLL